MINSAQFVTDYPEFSNRQTYKPSAINYWMNLAGLLLNTCRLGVSAADPWPTSNPPPLAIYDVAVELFIAHNLAIEAQNQAAAAASVIPGQTVGPVNSKGVDKVNVSYDVNAGIDPAAGHWNLTNYGTRLYQLLQMFGAGAIQVGADCGFGTLGAWPGPNPLPGWFSS